MFSKGENECIVIPPSFGLFEWQMTTALFKRIVSTGIPCDDLFVFEVLFSQALSYLGVLHLRRQ